MSKNNVLHSQKLNCHSKYKSGGVIHYRIHFKLYLKSIFQTFLWQICRFGQLAKLQVGGRFIDKSAFGTKEVQADLVQGGRSMIEMLGVLAIIGVLSVGGIAGYSKAMEVIKINKLISGYNQIVHGVLERGSKVWTQNGQYTISADELEALNLIPDGFNELRDSEGISFGFQNSTSYCKINISLQKNSAKTEFNSQFCRKMLHNFVIPSSDIMHLFWLHTYTLNPDNSKSDSQSLHLTYGSRYCKGDRKCIRDISPVEVADICNACESGKNCTFVMEIDWAY